VLSAYDLPADDATMAARAARERGEGGWGVSGLDMASVVDWSPEEVWGPGPQAPPPR